MRFVVGVFGLGVLAATMVPAAQSIRPETIKDQPIGWMRILTFPKPPVPATVDTRHYSTAQFEIAERFVTWMQATYVPIGGLGDIVKSVSEKLGPYNQITAALPQSYGALARIYTDLKYDESKKMVRATNSHVVWSVMANGVFGEPIQDLSTAEHYYLTLPPFSLQQSDGEKFEQPVDTSRHPILGQFPSWYGANFNNGSRKHVMLTRNDQLPYTVVSRGEFLAAVEAAVGRRYATEKSKIGADANAKYREMASKDLEALHAKRLAVLASQKEKYKARLTEPAEVATTQPDSLLENVPDVFEGNGGSRTRLTVYTISPAAIAAARTDQPQWITVAWTAQPTDPASRHLHDAVVNQFDFEYVRDYFFNPEKVKGRPYAPRK